MGVAVRSMSHFRGLLLATLACALGAPAASASAPLPFAPDSVWNTAIPAAATVQPGSGLLVASLVAQVRLTAPWIATTTYSTPVYRVGPNVPRVPVAMDAVNPVLRAQMASVPVPASAVPSQDTDGRVVVWQRSTDTLWEFWRMRREADGWHATYGGRIEGVSRSTGVHDAPLGSTASGLSLLGGLILPSEIRRGRIDHALALGVPNTARGTFVGPANRTDGTTLLGGIPMGTRLRLDPHVDIASLGLPRTARIIARAAQRYGMVVRDTSGAVAFYGEESRRKASPWPALLAGLSPSQQLMRFPYDRLQVVAP